MEKRKYLEPALHTLVWTAGFILIAGFVNNIGVIKRDAGNFIYPIIVGTLINIALFYTVSFYFIPENSIKNNWKKFSLFMLLLLFVTTLTESALDYSLFPVYYSSNEETFVSQFVVTLIINIFILALALGYGFIRVWVKAEKQKQSLKSEKLSAELNFLKAQVNPHVLFNMLNMAFSSATQNRDERTADIIEKIASQMRYMLYESNVSQVALTKEIEHIDGYISLQMMRISPEIPVKVKWKVTGEIETYSIAPLLLIPFIENAFKFGVSYNEHSEITIDIICDNGILTLKTSNFTRKSVSIRDTNSGIGLENVKKRLELLYPGKHLLEISDSGNLFIVNLTLCLK